MPVLKKIASLAILAFILGLASEHIAHFLRWPPPAYTQPGVFNLTREKIEWEVHYGTPELCGKIECHLLENYASANFSMRQVLPVREFPLKGYKPGQIIYYRTKIKIPDHLIQEEAILILHTLNIWAERYLFFVNGRLVDAGSMDTLSIPIPRGLIPENREVTLTFRVDPGKLHYQGLAHMSDIMLGTKEGFASMRHAAHDLKNSYYLWHLLPRLTVCLVFIFFLIALSRETEIFMLVLYSFTGSMYVYLVSDLPKVVFSEVSAKASVAPVVNILSSVLFFAVIHRFFRRPYGKWSKIGFSAGALTVIAAGVTAFLVPAGRLHAVSNEINYMIRIAGSLYAIYLSTLTWRYLKRSGKSAVRQRMSSVVLVFNVCVLAVYLSVVMKVIPMSHWSLTIFVSDTLILILFSALVGQEFGTTVGQRDEIKNTFKRFIGAPVVDRLVHGVRTKPKEQDVTVMFCDIRGFTTMCESLHPSAVFDFLNSYLEMMVQVISKHGGLIDKFGGDSILAVWGAPDPDPEHPYNASACALAMRAALVRFNRGRSEQGLGEVRIGIGVHTGPVISGAVGSDERQEYTVLGDTVNTTARIEGLTKEHGTDIIISGVTWKRLEGKAIGRSLGTSQVKGRSEIVELFALESLTDASEREAA